MNHRLHHAIGDLYRDASGGDVGTATTATTTNNHNRNSKSINKYKERNNNADGGRFACVTLAQLEESSMVGLK
jgi:hypothetical protein